LPTSQRHLLSIFIDSYHSLPLYQKRGFDSLRPLHPSQAPRESPPIPTFRPEISWPFVVRWSPSCQDARLVWLGQEGDPPLDFPRVFSDRPPGLERSPWSGGYSPIRESESTRLQSGCQGRGLDARGGCDRPAGSGGVKRAARPGNPPFPPTGPPWESTPLPQAKRVEGGVSYQPSMGKWSRPSGRRPSPPGAASGAVWTAIRFRRKILLFWNLSGPTYFRERGLLRLHVRIFGGWLNPRSACEEALFPRARVQVAGFEDWGEATDCWLQTQTEWVRPGICCELRSDSGEAGVFDFHGMPQRFPRGARTRRPA